MATSKIELSRRAFSAALAATAIAPYGDDAKRLFPELSLQDPLNIGSTREALVSFVKADTAQLLYLYSHPWKTISSVDQLSEALSVSKHLASKIQTQSAPSGSETLDAAYKSPHRVTVFPAVLACQTYAAAETIDEKNAAWVVINSILDADLDQEHLIVFQNLLTSLNPRIAGRSQPIQKNDPLITVRFAERLLGLAERFERLPEPFGQMTVALQLAYATRNIALQFELLEVAKSFHRVEQIILQNGGALFQFLVELMEDERRRLPRHAIYVPDQHTEAALCQPTDGVAKASALADGCVLLWCASLFNSMHSGPEHSNAVVRSKLISALYDFDLVPRVEHLTRKYAPLLERTSADFRSFCFDIGTRFSPNQAADRASKDWMQLLKGELPSRTAGDESFGSSEYVQGIGQAVQTNTQLFAAWCIYKGVGIETITDAKTYFAENSPRYLKPGKVEKGHE
ncbi:MAG: hypothetical protein AAGM21_12745 [Pseudomonadota bacterium]